MFPCATVNFLFLCNAFVIISVLYFNNSSNVSFSTENCILQHLAYIGKKMLEEIQINKVPRMKRGIKIIFSKQKKINIEKYFLRDRKYVSSDEIKALSVNERAELIYVELL